MKKHYSYKRSLKIADKVHKEVAGILRYKVHDPRLNWITLNEVEVTDDNSFATIYWTTIAASKKDEINKALLAATVFIRSELAHTFQTYTIPHIKFVYDSSLERGERIVELLNKSHNTKTPT